MFFIHSRLVLLLFFESLWSVLVFGVLVFSSSWNLFLCKLNVLDYLFLKIDWTFLNTCVCLLVYSLIELALGLVLFSLLGIENILWQVSMVVYSSDFICVDIFLHKFLSVLNGSALSLVNDTCRFVCNIFPHTDVHVFRTRKNIISVHCVWNWTNNLHSFGVINFARSSFIILEYSDCSVEWTCNKLSACRREVNVCNGSNVIFMNRFCFIHFSQIETVTVGVIITNCEVDRL